MDRIIDVTKTKAIKLDDVKIPFKIKLLQYNINNLLYEYNNKYAFPPYISKLKHQLSQVIINSNLKDNQDAIELITKARVIYKQLDKYLPPNNTNITDINSAIDNTLRFLLYQFNNKKDTITPQEQLNLIQELKTILEITKQYNLSSNRIDNTYKLYHQLKERLISHI